MIMKLATTKGLATLQAPYNCKHIQKPTSFSTQHLKNRPEGVFPIEIIAICRNLTLHNWLSDEKRVLASPGHALVKMILSHYFIIGA